MLLQPYRSGWAWRCQRDCTSGGTSASAQLAAIAGVDHRKICNRPMPVRTPEN